MSLQRLPPEEALQKTDEPLTPEPSYLNRLLKDAKDKALKDGGVKTIASILISAVLVWLKGGSVLSAGLWGVLTFVLLMAAIFMFHLFLSPRDLDKVKQKEIDSLREAQKKITKGHAQQIAELQTRLDEAESHKLIFELDPELFRSEVELEDYSDDEDDHAYRIRAGLKIRFVNNDVHPILVRRISLSLVRDAGTIEILLPETFPATWKLSSENWRFKGLSVPASTATEDHWFDIRVDVPHVLNDYMKSGTDLRITMDASRQKPYFKDLAINWRAAERGPHSIIAFRSTLDRLSSNAD